MFWTFENYNFESFFYPLGSAGLGCLLGFPYSDQTAAGFVYLAPFQNLQHTKPTKLKRLEWKPKTRFHLIKTIKNSLKMKKIARLEKYFMLIMIFIC